MRDGSGAETEPTLALLADDDDPRAGALRDWLVPRLGAIRRVARAQDAPEAVLLRLVTHPVVALSRAIGAGSAPSAALAEWKEAARRLLGDCRAIRRRLALMDRDMLMAGDAEALAALARRLDRDPAAPGEATAPPPSAEPETPDAFAMTLARALLAGDGAAAELASEIAAQRTGPVPAQARADHADAAWQAVRETRTGMADELRLLRRSLELQLEMTEAEQARHATLRDAHQAVTQDRDRMAAREKALDRDLGNCRQAARAREAALARQVLRDGRERQRLADRIAELETELAAVYASNSWRATRVLRSLRRRGARHG